MTRNIMPYRIPKNQLIRLNEILRFAEIILLSGFLLYFMFTVFRINPICIASGCSSNLFTMSLMDLAVVTVLPIFVFFGVLRVLINFTINDHDKSIEIPFYTGLIGILITYLIFSFQHNDFFYIYAKNNDIQTEPLIVTVELIIFLISGLLLLSKKRNWDKSVFFVKLRVIFFVIHLVIMTVNINFGVVAFLLSIPFLIWTDLKIDNHYHKEIVEEHFGVEKITNDLH
jgi:hypothetical protein